MIPRGPRDGNVCSLVRKGVLKGEVHAHADTTKALADVEIGAARVLANRASGAAPRPAPEA